MIIIKIIIIYFFIRNFYLVLKRKLRLQKKKKYNTKNISSFNIGSSHSELAFKSLNPDLHLNLAHPSQTLYYDYILLKKFKNKIVKNQNLTCFLTISYFTFYAPKLWQKENIKNYYECLGMREIEREYRIEAFFYKYFPILYKVYEKMKKNINKEIDVEKRIKKHIVILKEQKNLDFNIAILEKIILLCRENNIKLILLTTPFQKEYNSQFNEKLLEENFYKIISKIIKKYEIDYFDFSKDYINFNKKKYFENYDFDHLSLEGSKKIIKILNKKLAQKIKEKI